jgi:hypothetical protein
MAAVRTAAAAAATHTAVAAAATLSFIVLLSWQVVWQAAWCVFLMLHVD